VFAASHLPVAGHIAHDGDAFRFVEI